MALSTVESSTVESNTVESNAARSSAAESTAGSTEPRWDLGLMVTGPPYGSDLTGSMLRLTVAALRRRAAVLVWACGYNTMLTQRSLGPVKPRNPADWHAVHPTTAALVGDLLAQYPSTESQYPSAESRSPGAGSLTWYVCRFCADDRGAGPQVDGVRLMSFSRLRGCVAACRKTLYLGGA